MPAPMEIGAGMRLFPRESVMMPGVISPTPSSSSSTRPSPRSRTKRSYRLRPSRHVAPYRNVSSHAHGASCQPQRGHRGGGDILAADLEPRHAREAGSHSMKSMYRA